MKIIFIVLTISLFILSCRVKDEQLKISPYFNTLTNNDSCLIFNILSHEWHTKHYIFKTDSFIILTLKKKEFDRVYCLDSTGCINYWIDMYKDKVIYSNKRLEQIKEN